MSHVVLETATCSVEPFITAPREELKASVLEIMHRRTSLELRGSFKTVCIMTNIFETVFPSVKPGGIYPTQIALADILMQ